MIIFVSGGARSGKSRFAEEKAMMIHHQRDIPSRLVYVATAKITDDEMAERIRFHKEDRTESWHTIEEPFDLASIPLKTKIGDVVLIDCLTIWLSNMLYSSDTHGSSFFTEFNEVNQIGVINMLQTLIMKAKEKHQTLIFVSNDVNEGEPMVMDSMVLDYIYELERIHQYVVKQADSAVQVIAGMALEWKGEEFS
ncbi:bifunctional adenosylcobinamide kinase/adenosylcobinamide-phosphate guanylyltransferase [Salipaludibacillus daqingensis]|uniref:bifunctional adenosylcobinamide kinase/adenosylcobinamide-phosphate guanylyltransferase n=1 Tax=Salipaludibacillus daqingensis TaxID=3041001 RepID=UPI002474D188|nr:bifunctional adenosylcobinamide kinase/adenosylcobinamide-phosphate guanylyltransferase [Salipaludibacillus daqingensis]